MKQETKIYIIGSVGIVLVIMLELLWILTRIKKPTGPCPKLNCKTDCPGPDGPCPELNCKTDCPADCSACPADCSACPADCSKCPPPPPVVTITKPSSANTTSSQNDAVKQYIMGLYPLLPTKNYNPDFWKTLDFFYNTACSNFVDIDTTGKRGDLYISDDTAAGQERGNPVFRYFMQRFDNAGTAAAADANQKNIKWILFSTPLANILADAPTAGFSYQADETKTAPGSPCMMEYNLYLKPLCSFRLPSGTGAIVQGVSVNRYPAGHLKTQGIAYAASNTANNVITANIITGVDQIHISPGFKSYSLIEIEHCDTGSKTRATSTSLPTCLNTCHVLASKCPGHMENPTTVGYGKWLYYSRGSGVWFNLGKTAVFQNKIDAIRGSIDGWDGKNRGGNYVNTTYRGEAQGKYSDWQSLQTWQNFVKDSNNDVKNALLAILNAPCNSKISMDMLDAIQTGTCSPIQDYLGLSEPTGVTEYTGPQCASAHYCDATKGITPGITDRNDPNYYDPSNDAPNTIALWWFWAILTNEGQSAQGDWGVLSPIAPAEFTDASNKLGWLLWVCTNGYDFLTNPNKYTWGPNFTRTYLNPATRETSDSLNRLIGNMGNSGYATDDVFIMYANYMQLDSIQLTTSAVVGNLISFELLTFTGSTSTPVQQTSGAPWQCNGVNANTKCIQDLTTGKENWVDPNNSLFFIADPTNVAAPTSYNVVANNCSDSQYGKGYYLAATNPSSQKVYAYYDNVPVSYPYDPTMIASCQQQPGPGPTGCPINPADAGGYTGSCNNITMTPTNTGICSLSASCKNIDNVSQNSTIEFRQGEYIDNINGVLTCFNNKQELDDEFNPTNPHAHIPCKL